MTMFASSSEQRAARESEAFLRTQNPVDVAAMQWHGRREQGMADADKAAFEQWLAADKAHAAALAHLEQSLSILRSLPAERTAHLRRLSSPPAAPPRPRRWQGSPGSFAAAALCCLALLAVGIGWRQWQLVPTFDQTYTAERGQRREITLPDGSQLTLDAGATVKVALYRNRRQVKLSEGQAMFSVARDASRPFTVLAGPARVTVLGTRFAVRCKACALPGAQVEVEVEEGHVSVAQASDGSAAELRAGQAVQLSAASLSAITEISPDSIAPWRKGLIRFASTPLAEALREFERYAPVHLLIRDPEVAAMPIGGSYIAADPAAFAQVLPHILPVRLLRRSDGTTEVVRKKE